MRKLFYLFIGVIVAALPSACSQTDKTTHEDDSTKLTLGVLPTMDCLPFYYADSTGLFEELGINIRLKTFEAAMDADTAFMNGDIDGVVSDLVKACIWQENGDSVHIALSGELRLWLVTAQNARLTKAGSLKEKIIGITRNSAVDFFTDKVLESAGLESIDLNKPQINNLKLRTLMIDQNQYDGAVLPEPYASEAVARGAKRLDGTTTLGAGQLLCVLFGDSVAKHRKAEIAAIRTAYDQAVTALNADTLLNPQDFIPAAHRLYLPDTLFHYIPLSPSSEPNEPLKQQVKTWAQGRGLIK